MNRRPRARADASTAPRRPPRGGARPAVVALACLLVCGTIGAAAAQDAATVRVVVRHLGAPVADALVTAAGRETRTGADGVATLAVPPGETRFTIRKEPFPAASLVLDAVPGGRHEVAVELEAARIEQEVTVSATRTDRRLAEQPMRVEVVPEEEVQEKLMMTPGDVSMLLNETNGLRVQTTSPALGGANVRIQGMRGRYTQILADGLPLHGGQTGSIGLLQIPPMDLAQVEVIKGAASALYGPSALGGVVNLVSKRPAGEPQRELLVNRTSHRGTDAVGWLSEKLGARWGYTMIGGVHLQDRRDLDGDGWTDLPSYRRAVARPRLFWDDGAGRSLMLVLGGTVEDRRGGTVPGSAGAGGAPFPQSLDTARLDAGGVGRFVLEGGRVLTARGSGTWARHRHAFGPSLERDAHRTFFGETAITGRSGAHVWVLGGAVQHESYASRDVPRFDFAHTVPGIFAQDDWDLASWLAVSASGRVDAHRTHGALASPRISALLRPGGAWTGRLSAGRGYFLPTPFTEETDAIGLSAVAPLEGLAPERADRFSADLTWARAPLEVTTTVFASRVRGAVQVHEVLEAPLPLALRNAPGVTRARGTEVIARFHRDEPELDVIVTHMYLWSTEPDPRAPGLRREVPLNPRHAGSLDILGEIGAVRLGIEIFVTGRQALDDNPYRERGRPYALFGALVDWSVGRARLFLNAENLGNVRQSRYDPLLRPSRTVREGPTVDAWAPLEGRTLNGGIRLVF